jgi:alpha-glucosidase
MVALPMARYRWWQRGVIYQVYTRSFMDSDGDGVGDLRGITSRLDYLASLGVTGIWLSPIYPSPMADYGHDVADYTGIHPVFGTMSDFDRMIEAAHEREIRVILDLVPNHTSDEHPWFRESRSSRTSLKRDWYIWREPAADGGPPNNWLSEFGGSAWKYDERTAQYYLHTFHEKQPDLNWRNPEVQETMFDVMRFWFDRGVDGFRLDVVWHLIKDAAFRDNPSNAQYDGSNPYRRLVPRFTEDQPEVHEVLATMRGVANEYEDRVLIAEVYLPFDRLVTYYGQNADEAHLPFNFQLITTPWNARALARMIEDYEKALPASAWPNWVLGNHDVPRIASRVGLSQARVAAMLLLTLRGTPLLYYGDEIGMRDVDIPDDLAWDPKARNMPGYGLGRDGCRTPMQWSGDHAAGFTLGAPWLPVAVDHGRINVETQLQVDGSLLALHRELIALRRAEPALSRGSLTLVPTQGDVLAFLRSADDRHLLVVLNLSSENAVFAPPKRLKALGEIMVSTQPRHRGKQVEGRLELDPNEGVVIALADY